jgi:hypothetical protein
MDNKKPVYKNIYFWLLLLFFIYSIVGFFVVPRVIKSNLEEISATKLNSSIEIDKVRFNPYFFSTDIYHVTFKDLDEKQWFSSDRIHANINLFKSIFGNISLSEITLDKPHYYLHLAQVGNGTIVNYPKLIPSEAESDEALALDINNINIHQGALSYFDDTTNTEVELKLNEIAFNHIGFTTEDKNSNFQLNFLTENNDKAEIKVHLY